MNKKKKKSTQVSDFSNLVYFSFSSWTDNSAAGLGWRGLIRDGGDQRGGRGKEAYVILFIRS